MNEIASGRQGFTLPMTITANNSLQLTLAIMRSRLRADDLEFLEKAIQLYGDLRINERLAESEGE